MKCPKCYGPLVGALRLAPTNFLGLGLEKEIHNTAEVWLYCKMDRDSSFGCGWASTRRFNVKEWL